MKIFLLIAALLLQLPLWAKDGPPAKSSMDNMLAILLVIIAVILLIVIATLANTVLGAASYQRDKQKQPDAVKTTVAVVMGFLLTGNSLYAQGENNQLVPIDFGGLSPLAFYLLMGVIFLEVLVIVVLLINLRKLVMKERETIAAEMAVEYKVAKPVRNWWERLNSFRPVKEEAQLDLGHNYDGIRELDNSLPKWWLYGFYLSIVFSAIYLYRYHVSHSAPLSGEEFAIAMRQAEEQKEAYLKTAASKVDESTVQLLQDESNLAAGKTVYTVNCVACHGQEGQGGVGPNLTDDYWIAGGDIKDIFKTIKYGRQEKGMRAWQEDLSPVQIAQVSSYIKKMHGTKPANAKEPQGELYNAAGSGADSAGANKTVVKN